eukprot:1560841-Prorocentrum_lima.AAC.1
MVCSDAAYLEGLSRCCPKRRLEFKPKVANEWSMVRVNCCFKVSLHISDCIPPSASHTYVIQCLIPTSYIGGIEACAYFPIRQ